MKHYHFLFLCTHNSARSIVSEVVATVASKGRFIGHSAGAAPSGHINPYAIDVAKHYGYPIEKLSSKSWDVFSAANAPGMDFIITVCDSAANEPCPVWVGRPATVHWGFADPSRVNGTERDIRAAFFALAETLHTRFHALALLPDEVIRSPEFIHHLKQIHTE